jgi:hypothetical protein
VTEWPKKFDASVAPPEMLALTSRLMELLLSGDDPSAQVLRDQYALASIAGMTLTGGGFVVDFAIPPSAPRVSLRTMIGGAAIIEMEGVEHGAGCVLFVREGVLQMLEGYAYADEWPERPVVKSIRDVVPLLPEGRSVERAG